MITFWYTIGPTFSRLDNQTAWVVAILTNRACCPTIRILAP